MSAMHWEARRRQAVLDRRSRSKQLKEDQPQPSPQEPSSPDQPIQPPVNESSLPKETHRSFPQAEPPTSVARGCIDCKGKPDSSVHYGAKLENRYNSLQYSQQW